MRFWYNLLFLVCFAAASPYYFFKMWRRGNWRTNFRQRFGSYDDGIKQSLTNRRVLWLHAVSVGEMNVCVQICRGLELRAPNLKLVVSTTTTTGMGELQSRLPPTVTKIYYPVDLRKYVSRAFTALRPIGIVLVESEIWPNLIWRARALHTPVLLANARLSDRSYPRYKRFGFLFRDLFGAFAAAGAQNDGDAARLRELGCHPEAVRTVGNLKFDAVNLEGRRMLDVAALLGRLGIPAEAPLLVAGSTHAGEEMLIARQFLRLRERFPSLVLALVPRHFERAGEVARELSRLGLKFVNRSDIHAETRASARPPQCVLVDTTGELMSFYKQATVVFVGKSLTAIGGQNPIEPAALGKPVVFGPNMQNFADVVRIFLERDAAIQVRDEAELESALAALLEDPARRAQLGRNAEDIVRQNQGAVARTVEMILAELDGNDLYLAPQK